jgi:hypothetical protein
MATGYTGAVAEGKIVTLPDFVRSCARGFMIECRDSDGPFPLVVKKSTYHQKEVTRARQSLLKLAKFTRAQILKFAENKKKNEISYHKESIATRNETFKRYTAMLAKVQAWTAPSENHQNLRKFMIEQLTESIRFDCESDYHEREVEKIDKQTPFEIYEAELKRAAWDISYHQKGDFEDEQRNNNRNEWVAQLEASLNPQPATQPKTKARKKRAKSK